MKYQNVEQLPVWQKAHNLTLLIYKATKNFPKSETYGLSSQIRRSSGSIGANISEGFSRKSTKELIQFLYNARGSCAETVYHLRLSKDLDYIDGKVYQEIRSGYDEVGKQLNGWISSLRRKL